eukprot:COSAG02_NODE_48033_length_336_cov_3.645570_1_plen_111_part_11
MMALVVSTTMADRPTMPRTPTATMAMQIEKSPASTAGRVHSEQATNDDTVAVRYTAQARALRSEQATNNDTVAVRHTAKARALRSELSQLKMPELRKRATDAGASRDAIED